MLFYLEPESFCFHHQKLPASPSNGQEGSCSLRRPNPQLTLKLKIFYPQNTWVLLSIYLCIRFIGTYLITFKMCFQAQIA